MYNEIVITKIIKTGLNNLIQSANQDGGSIISDIATTKDSDVLVVRLLNGQKFEIKVYPMAS